MRILFESRAHCTDLMIIIGLVKSVAWLLDDASRYRAALPAPCYPMDFVYTSGLDNEYGALKIM